MFIKLIKFLNHSLQPVDFVQARSHDQLPVIIIGKSSIEQVVSKLDTIMKMVC